VNITTRVFGAFAAAALALALAGCTDAEPAAAPTELDLSNLDTRALLPTPKPGPVEGYDPDQPITLEQAALISLNTFVRFDQFGIIERQTNEQGQFLMLHNPNQKDSYGGAWFDLQTDKGVLILDAYQFASAWAYLVMSDPENRKSAYFQGNLGGFSLQYDDPQVGRFGYNYLTDGELLTGAWWAASKDGVSRVYTIDFDYELTDEWANRLDGLVAEELAGRNN
jgi:hypothetical protein